jgi:hypothetical protein
VEPATLGDPVRPLLWVSKSHDKLAAALRAMGHKISARQREAAAADARLPPADQPKGRRLAGNILIAMLSSTSTPGGSSARPPGSPSFRSIRRRRSWSATTRTAARTIVARAIRNV